MSRTIALLLLAAASAPPLAAESVTASRTVATADLDLSTAAGVRALEHRLTVAIVDACGEASDVDLQGANQVRACRVEARRQVAGERDRIIAERTTANVSVASR